MHAPLIWRLCCVIDVVWYVTCDDHCAICHDHTGDHCAVCHDHADHCAVCHCHVAIVVHRRGDVQSSTQAASCSPLTTSCIALNWKSLGT